MGSNPYSPLTTTNSPKQLIMAVANLKPRRPSAPCVQHISAVLRDASANDSTLTQATRIAFPWTQITKHLLAHPGFLPGQHVLFSVDY